MPTPVSDILHLYRRAGFGIGYEQAKALSGKSIKDIVDGLFSNAGMATYLNEVSRDAIPQGKDAMEQGMSKKELNQLIKDYSEKLNTGWIRQLNNTQSVLLEKQTLFWHNHFACRLRNPYLLQELNNIHRKFAFASFRELLFNVSKSAAMLQFLNNQQNRKTHPNENFARELMELFTIGRGNYTEQDIKESARAFTGWGFDRDTYAYVFRDKQHDFDSKTFMGRSGNFGGEDIINMLMDDRRTARFIARKLYVYYVNDVVNEKLVDELGLFYYNNYYDTGKLLKKIFTADWFYKPGNKGCLIKSPVEFLVTLNRQFNVAYNDPNVFLAIQKNLGQLLFFPPNVAGWPGGKTWIDSSTLMLRLRLPSLLLNDGMMEFDTRLDEPDITTDSVSKKQATVSRRFNTSVDWTAIAERYKEASLEQLEAEYLAVPLNTAIENTVTDANSSVQERLLKLISLPQYQLV